MNAFAVTHAGSLPRTPELLGANASRQTADDGFTLIGNDEHAAALRHAVHSVVGEQVACGVTVPNDGEYGKAMNTAVNYGPWWRYIFQRVEGLELTGADPFGDEHIPSSPGKVRLTSFLHRRDRELFPGAYNDPDSGITFGSEPLEMPATTGPLSYRGAELLATDIDNLKAALHAHGVETGFVTALSPGSGARIADHHYGSEREHIFAWADVLREEYRAITDAGLLLQIDDPSVAENWDQINPEPSIEDYREFTRLRVEALNYALEGIPEDQVRFHLCWGSWHGPHVTDIELRYIVDLVLEINAKYYSFEAANVRHEHEWKVWRDVQLPEGKVLLPGIVSHATNVVEHPELVADRITRFAEVVGPERVQPSTDCGLGGRIHPEIAWAKLRSLSEGAGLAAARL